MEGSMLAAAAIGIGYVETAARDARRLVRRPARRWSGAKEKN